MGEPQDAIGRRIFLGGVAAAAALSGGAAGADPGPSRPRSAESTRPDFILDSHIHCGGDQAWVDEMVTVYRRHNAMACVLTWIEDLELMVDAIRAHPDVFIGYGRVRLDDPAAVRQIEAFKKNGFVGMKFHSPRESFDHPSYFQAYRLCEEYGLVMLFHTGISSRREFESPTWGSSARMRPIYLDTICRQFPRVVVQGAHLGNPWYEEAAEAARWNPNLYFDVTGSTLPKLIKLGRLDRLGEILWWSAEEGEANPHTLKNGPAAWEHIVFGTDEGPSGLEPNIERFQMMLDANGVSETTRRRMWGLTMAEVLGIDPETRRFRA
jgi:predicted TIM-barrel fold metal-dependent hydrolase